MTFVMWYSVFFLQDYKSLSGNALFGLECEENEIEKVGEFPNIQQPRPKSDVFESVISGNFGNQYYQHWIHFFVYFYFAWSH